MSLLWKTAKDEAEEYFHGTTHAFEPGDQVRPAREHGHRTNYLGTSDPEYAYATTKEDDAWWYGEGAWGMPRPAGGPPDHPRVYRVRPLGPVEKDPPFDEHGRSRSNFERDVRSRHGFEVLSEMPMPERMGKPEEWR